MQKKMSMSRKALATPGIAPSSATMILLSDLTRLKSRSTRSARSSVASRRSMARVSRVVHAALPSRSVGALARPRHAAIHRTQSSR